MEFMLKDRDHFHNYVAEDFTLYIQRKRQDGCYANNPEIQASSELFNRPIEVYTFFLARSSNSCIIFLHLWYCVLYTCLSITITTLKTLAIFYRFTLPRPALPMVLLTFSMVHTMYLKGTTP